MEYLRKWFQCFIQTPKHWRGNEDCWETAEWGPKAENWGRRPTAGWSSDRPKVSTILSTLGCLSWHYNIYQILCHFSIVLEKLAKFFMGLLFGSSGIAPAPSATSAATYGVRVVKGDNSCFTRNCNLYYFAGLKNKLNCRITDHYFRIFVICSSKLCLWTR